MSLMRSRELRGTVSVAVATHQRQFTGGKIDQSLLTGSDEGDGLEEDVGRSLDRQDDGGCATVGHGIEILKMIDSPAVG